jgi:hypothetical protein
VHLRNLTAILDTKKRDSLSRLAAPLARLPTMAGNVSSLRPLFLRDVYLSFGKQC